MFSSHLITQSSPLPDLRELIIKIKVILGSIEDFTELATSSVRLLVFSQPSALKIIDQGCTEYPHIVVLLLCLSHNKACRPYMCGTRSRYSNCLDQYKKAYAKTTSLSPPQLTTTYNSPVSDSWPVEKHEQVTELACPLCRGQVKGWIVWSQLGNILF
ncbi:hypothetical protein R6Q59_031886 [Mikania micrantha]